MMFVSFAGVVLCLDFFLFPPSQILFLLSAPRFARIFYGTPHLVHAIAVLIVSTA